MQQANMPRLPYRLALGHAGLVQQRLSWGLLHAAVSWLKPVGFSSLACTNINSECRYVMI
jgi:hypothetical protein